MSKHTQRAKLLAFGLGLFFLAGLGVWQWGGEAGLDSSRGEQASGRTGLKSGLATNHSARSASVGIPSVAVAASVAEPDQVLMKRFTAWLGMLRANAPRAQILAELASLKAALDELDPDVAAATVIELLKAGDDASTGLVLRVGEEGVLDEPTTYRVALLDLLGQTEPEAALAYSREVLDLKTTQDEYAIALRNVAWLNYEHQLDAELHQRFAEMVTTPSWLGSPSNGFLEAFDVAVEVGGLKSLYTVAQLIRVPASSDIFATSDSVNHAGFLALDRLMLREPETVIAAFVADPTFLADNPHFRASLMSRIDPTQPGQRGALEHYLTGIQHASGELEYFASIYPNANYIDGNRLVTGWETVLQSVDVAKRDERILPYLESLRADPAYAAVSKALDEIILRLREFQSPVNGG